MLQTTSLRSLAFRKFGGFHQCGYPNSWMVYFNLFQGQSQSKMDENWGCPHFRKPFFQEVPEAESLETVENQHFLKKASLCDSWGGGSPWLNGWMAEDCDKPKGSTKTKGHVLDPWHHRMVELHLDMTIQLQEASLHTSDIRKFSNQLDKNCSFNISRGVLVDPCPQKSSISSIEDSVSRTKSRQNADLFSAHAVPNSPRTRATWRGIMTCLRGSVMSSAISGRNDGRYPQNPKALYGESLQ